VQLLCPTQPQASFAGSAPPQARRPTRQLGVIFSSYKNPVTTELFLRSWRKYHNFDVLIMTNLPHSSRARDPTSLAMSQNLQAKAKEYGAKIMFFDEDMYKKTDFLPDYLPFMNKRVLILRDWLRSNGLNLKPDDRMFFADEDLFFTGNPFQVFDDYKNRSLFFFREAEDYTNNSGYNKDYIQLSTDVYEMKNFVEKKQVYCMGFVMGHVREIHNLLERMTTAFFIKGFPAENSKHLASDQGTLNLLIHTGLLDDLRIQLIGDDEPYVCHLTSQLRRRDLLKFALNHTVVHQYKWANAVKAWIEDTYGFDAKSRWG